MRRPLRPLDGQLRRLPGRLRLRVSRAQGLLAFAPRLSPDDFRAAFTTAEGWGTFSQKREPLSYHASLQVRWGRLKLRRLTLGARPGFRPEIARVTNAGVPLNDVKLTVKPGDPTILLEFPSELTVKAGDSLEITLK